MLTVSQLARRFGLSRSTLLYYDSIGLLSPAARSRANYRLYSPREVERMELIDLYRKAGLPLADIARVIGSEQGALTELLEARMRALNGEIQGLRRQQQMVIELLRSRVHRRGARCLDKEGWVAILRATGLEDEDMERWHAEFERLSPEAHQDFLESLGLKAAEITRMRSRYRRLASPGKPRRRRGRVSGPRPGPHQT
jgi:DNA-binding transcriptional MerR regulator